MGKEEKTETVKKKETIDEYIARMEEIWNGRDLLGHA